MSIQSHEAQVIQKLEKCWAHKKSYAQCHPWLSWIFNHPTLRAVMQKWDAGEVAAMSLMFGVIGFMPLAIALSKVVDAHHMTNHEANQMVGLYVVSVLSWIALMCGLRFFQVQLNKCEALSSDALPKITAAMQLSPVFQATISNWFNESSQLTLGDFANIERLLEERRNAARQDQRQKEREAEQQKMQASLLGVLQARTQLETHLPLSTTLPSKKHL